MKGGSRARRERQRRRDAPRASHGGGTRPYPSNEVGELKYKRGGVSEMWRIQRTQKTPNREKKQRNDGLHREGASKGDFPFVSARRPYTYACLPVLYLSY